MILKKVVLDLKGNIKPECATAEGMENLFAEKVVRCLNYFPFAISCNRSWTGISFPMFMKDARANRPVD